MSRRREPKSFQDWVRYVIAMIVAFLWPYFIFSLLGAQTQSMWRDLSGQ